MSESETVRADNRNPVARCVLTSYNGSQLEMLAERVRCDDERADFIIRWDAPTISGGREKGECTVEGFPRGAGLDGLFGRLLCRIGGNGPARDDEGKEYPMPEPTLDEMRTAMRLHWESYHALGKEILKRTAAEKKAAKAGRT